MMTQVFEPSLIMKRNCGMNTATLRFLSISGVQAWTNQTKIHKEIKQAQKLDPKGRRKISMPVSSDNKASDDMIAINWLILNGAAKLIRSVKLSLIIPVFNPKSTEFSSKARRTASPPS